MGALGAWNMLGAVLLVDDLEVFSNSNGSMIPQMTWVLLGVPTISSSATEAAP